MNRGEQLTASTPILIAGPTAAGKSEVAMTIAQRVGGEIISVDSMQVYRGLDIGTAKPSVAERARVRHHLIDILDLDQAFDAARFVALAEEAIRDIQSRNRVPILCGGTGLYFKALLEGLGDAPPANPALRLTLEQLPLTDLWRELAERDPVCYERIDRSNRRRVVRAVEVIRLTGRPYSEQQASWRAANATDRRHASESEKTAWRAFGIARSNSDLHRRIDCRVDEMFRRGLIKETEALLDRGLGQNRTALQALGYRQVVEHLRGEKSLTATVELVKVRTRQFAKRQMTWFRRQLDLTWLQLEPGSDPGETAQAIVIGATDQA